MFRILGIARPVVGDTRSARESDVTIDDECFAMRSVIVSADSAPTNRVVPFDLAAAGFQNIENFFSDCGRSHCIQEDLYLCSGLDARCQSVRESHPNFALPIDVR